MFKLISGPVPGFSSLFADRGLMQLKPPNQSHLSPYCYRKMHGLKQEIETAVPNAACAARIRAGGCVWGHSHCHCQDSGTHPHVRHVWLPSPHLHVSFPPHRDPLPFHWPAQLFSTCPPLQGSSMAFEQSGGSPCSADSPLLPFLEIFPVCVPKVK